MPLMNDLVKKSPSNANANDHDGGQVTPGDYSADEFEEEEFEEDAADHGNGPEIDPSESLANKYNVSMGGDEGLLRS